MTECLIIRLLVLVGVCLGVRAEEAGYENPSCGGKTVIVQLFEWKWTDIALECQRFLAPAGFCGVQICTKETLWVAVQTLTSKKVGDCFFVSETFTEPKKVCTHK